MTASITPGDAEARGDSPTRIVPFLRGLRRESGGYADTSAGEHSLRATLSVLKALRSLGVVETDPQTVEFVRRCRLPDGSFAIAPGGAPSAFDTADGLIALRTLGQVELLDRFLPDGLSSMASVAATQFDHFMLIATYEECGVEDAVPPATIAFFERQLAESLAATKVLDGAIAASSLLRAGERLDDPDAVAALMRSGQATVEGGFADGDTASLFTGYCAMRTLALLGEPPDTRRLTAYLDSLRTPFGYADAPGGTTAASATYMALGMREWLRELQRGAVASARAGDPDAIGAWLAAGGDPDLYDSDGWTPLLAAASHGRARVVDLLLKGGADPELRLREADALPIYLAGQAGDVDTVARLLEADPSHRHAISRINGHTVLLQAAFYGKSAHQRLATYLLDTALGDDDRIRLLSATNMRGYSALTMQDLWHNEPMKQLLARYYPDGDDLGAEREAYYRKLLLDIATPQALTERLMEAIADHLDGEDAAAAEARIDTILTQPGLDLDRLGGPLRQTPLIFALTGVDVGHPERAARRRALTAKLLEAGADPAVREVHPMAVGAVIRASVLNNFDLLRLLADHMTPEAFAAEMNVSPAVNGLTAMHDAIHRALSSPPDELEGHLEQIRWMIERGASLDLPDHVGQTQRQLVDAAQSDPAFPQANVRAVLAVVRSSEAGA